MTLMLVEKANPLWDGDGVQGAGQPRDRRGRWIHFPGPTSVVRALIKQVGSRHHLITEDSNRNQTVHSKHRSAKSANEEMGKLLRADADAFVENQKSTSRLKRTKGVSTARREHLAGQGRNAGPSPSPNTSVPAAGQKKPARVARKVTYSTTERLPVPGQPTQAQVNDANVHARRNMPETEAKYAALVTRLLKNKGVTQDPSRRGDINSKYGISPKRQVEIEQTVYEKMFPKTRVQRPKKKIAPRSAKQAAEMEKNFPLAGDGILPLRDGSRNSYLYRQYGPGKNSMKLVVTNRNGQTRLATPSEEAFFNKARKYRREQQAILIAHIRDREQQKAAKIRIAQRWARGEGFDPNDSYWWAFFWNDPTLLSSDKAQEAFADPNARQLDYNPGPVQRREKMDPALLERLLAMPDVDSHKMRGHKPERNVKPKKGDEDFVDASPESRRISMEQESANRERQIKHDRRLHAAYTSYKQKHPKSKISLAEFTDSYYNNKLRIPGGARGGIKKRRQQPEGYLRETEKIKENKKTHEGTVHKFTAAKWTHPNGHPRCLLCGDEEPISPECGRPATPEEEQASMDRIRASVSKAGFDPHEPRDFHGRWSRIGGILHGLEQTMQHTGTPNRRSSGRTLKDKGPVKGAFDMRNKTVALKIGRPQKGSSHAQFLADGSRARARRNFEPETAYFLRNNGRTRITDSRLKEIYEDRSKATAEEKDLLWGAKADIRFDGGNPIPIRSVREGGAQRKVERYKLVKDLRTQLAQDRSKKMNLGSKGATGHQLLHGAKDDRAKAQRIKDNEKRRANQRNFINRAERQRLIDDFGDGKKAKCIFCGTNVTTDGVSPERMKPGLLGGKYERGNMAPAHVRCNERAGTEAQYHSEAYYEKMMKKFLAMYKPEIRSGKLGFVFGKHRKHLGGKRP